VTRSAMGVTAGSDERRGREQDDDERTRPDHRDGARPRERRSDPPTDRSKVPRQHADQRDLQRRCHQVQRPDRLDKARVRPEWQPDRARGHPGQERAQVNGDGDYGDRATLHEQAGNRPGNLEPGEGGKGDPVWHVLGDVVPDRREMDRRGTQRQPGGDRRRPESKRNSVSAQPAGATDNESGHSQRDDAPDKDQDGDRHGI